MNTLSKTDFGKFGESLAKEELEKLGHTILFTNFRNRLGEIDIISFLNGCLHLTEVKTWASHKGFHPLSTFNATKQRRMRKVYNFFILKFPALSHLTVSINLVHITEKKEVYFYYALF